MDPRVHEHAELLVDWSARITGGEDVIVSVSEGAHDLAVAVAGVLGERGANPRFLYDSAEVNRAYLRAADGFDTDPEFERELFERADAYLRLGGGRNTAVLTDVPEGARREHSRARQEIREARLATDWVSTVHPTRSLAQQAGMPHRAYQEFVYDAVLRDWESLAEEMERLKRILDAGSEVRIENDRTSLTMSIEDRTAVNSAASVAYDSHNLPSGEVFTAPVADSVDGDIVFDVPMTIRGERVQNVRLVFDGGEVVEFGAGAGESAVASVLETDDGARRLGELGVGMNRGIDRTTDSILFDEKMAGTVHLALGRAYDACLPDRETGNESATHTDLITDVTADARILVDGETIQQNGVFRWEDGFVER
jgi:aminopeptidase